MKIFDVQIVFDGVVIWKKTITARDGIEAIEKAQGMYRAPSGATFRVKRSTILITP